MRRLFTAIGCLLLTAPLMALQPAEGQGGFVPADQLPTAEPIPAAPLLIAAYAFAWVAVLFFVWTIWRRLTKVERDIHTLERRQTGRSDTR